VTTSEELAVTSRTTTRPHYVRATAAGLCLLAVLSWPELADAALRNAAGGGGDGGGGFATLTRYLDRLASFLIPVGAAGAVLGLIAGGFMFMAGNPGAQRVLGYVAVGVVIVLASKGLAA
jgi:type IV secretory pathway VirB2 component (pilin)